MFLPGMDEVRHGLFRRDQRIGDDLTGLQFALTVMKTRSHRDYFEANRGWVFSTADDYDGSPLEDFYKVELKMPDRRFQWAVDLTYVSVGEDNPEFEYSQMASRSLATAYRMGSMPERMTRFAFQRCGVTCCEDPALWAQDFHQRVEADCRALEAAEGDLALWAEAGFDMRASCQAPKCGGQSSIPNGRLREFVATGLTLPTLRQWLACKECRTRKPRLRPA